MKNSKIQNNIYFKAKYETYFPLKKFGKEINANFLKIDCQNKSDIEALKDIAKHWENGLYTGNFYNTAYFKHNNGKFHWNYDVYALTLQKDNFEKLDSEKILGLVEITHKSQKNAILIDHIEGCPKYINATDRVYDGIGTAMIKSLQKIYSRIELIARKSLAVSNFYKNNDFIEFPEKSGFFIWMKNVADDVNSYFYDIM